MVESALLEGEMRVNYSLYFKFFKYNQPILPTLRLGWFFNLSLKEDNLNMIIRLSGLTVKKDLRKDF